MPNSTTRAGRHFLQIPGPTPIPDRIMNAMSEQILDHRGPSFQKLAMRVLDRVKLIFKTTNPVLLFPSSGTGSWESALSNTLSPGDKVLMVETGQFGLLWKQMAERLGLEVQFLTTDWRIGADAALVEAALQQDKSHAIKAVCIVQNETSTGCRSWIDEIRQAMDSVKHPALLMADTISSLGVMDLRHDEWGIDCTICGSQKGLMLPPGLSLLAISQKAIEASKTAKLKRAYFSWDDMLANNANGFFPYTPATSLLYGLDEAIDMLTEEGLDNVFARHEHLAEATRRAVAGWGLEVWCRDPKYYSPAVTTIAFPEGHNADQFRSLVLDRFNLAIGSGLNKLAGKAFRIGHLGYTNELTLLAALSGVEMGLELAGVPHRKGGVAAAMDFIAARGRPAAAQAA